MFSLGKGRKAVVLVREPSINGSFYTDCRSTCARIVNRWSTTRSLSSSTIFANRTSLFHWCVQTSAHLLADCVDVLRESFWKKILCCNDLNFICTIHGYLYGHLHYFINWNCIFNHQCCIILYSSSFLNLIYLLSSIMLLWALRVSLVRINLEQQHVHIWANVNIPGQMVWSTKIIRIICVWYTPG